MIPLLFENVADTTFILIIMIMDLKQCLLNMRIFKYLRCIFKNENEVEHIETSLASFTFECKTLFSMDCSMVM